MPLDQLYALTEEYYRDFNLAKLQATILNASGSHSKTFTVEDFLMPAEMREAPPLSQHALRDALKNLGKNHGKK